jgi:hypothetical protein
MVTAGKAGGEIVLGKFGEDFQRLNKPVSRMLGPSCSGTSRPKRQPRTMIGANANCVKLPGAEDAPNRRLYTILMSGTKYSIQMAVDS